VLEEVGKAGALARLDAKTDLVIDGDGDGRRTRVWREHDLQPIRQFVISDGHVEAILRRRHGGDGLLAASLFLRQRVGLDGDQQREQQQAESYGKGAANAISHRTSKLI